MNGNKEGSVELKIGRYTICRLNEQEVWIQSPTGEAGSFDATRFEMTVAAFFDANF